MPPRALAVVVRSLSPSRLGCLAMFALGYRAHGFGSGVGYRTIGMASAPSCRRARTAAAAGVTSTGAMAVRSGDEGSGDVVIARSGGEGSGEVAATVEPEVRKWLGNGPDPMAHTGKVRPWEGPATALRPGGRGSEEKIWMGNGPDPMAAMQLERATAEAEGEIKNVATEEIWLNGPFKAPMPPGPLVRL